MTPPRQGPADDVYAQLFDVSPFPAVVSRLRDHTVLAVASDNSGAQTTSVKMPEIASAVGPSSGRLTAMMPPKAETLSHAKAA